MMTPQPIIKFTLVVTSLAGAASCRPHPENAEANEPKPRSATPAELQRFAKSLPPIGPELVAGQAMLFDLKNGQQIRTFRRYGDHLRHVRFSPDDKQAVLNYYNSSVLWDVDSGETVREFDQGGIAQFSADGESVLIYDNLVAYRHDIATGNQVEMIQLPTHGPGFKSHYTRDNAHIANKVRHDSSGKLIYDTQKSSVPWIVDAASGKDVGRCPSNSDWCFVSGATKRVFQGGPLRPYHVVRVFDFAQQEVARFDMPAGELEGSDGLLLAVSPDGGQFLYARPVKGDAESPIPHAKYLTRLYSLHDAATGEELKELGRFGAGYTACFSPDGRRTVLVPTYAHQGTDVRDPQIIVIDNTTGEVEHQIYSGPWALPSVDFDRSGERLLVAGAINVRSWRRFHEWRQLEQKNPMPRKVADAVQVIMDWRNSQQ